MPGSATNYTENALLDGFLGDDHTSAFGATVYLALFTATPGDTGGGTEVSTGSYARVSMTNNDTNWPNASSGQKPNGTVITFPTASADWGTVTHWGVYSASTAGTLYWYGTIGTSRDVVNGDGVFFPVGGLIVTLD